MLKKLIFASTVFLSSANFAHAAIVVTGDVTKSSGNSWVAQFGISNDGTLPQINSFSIFLDWTHASNLLLLQSPSTWDSIVIQSDIALKSDGYLDALVLDASNAILPGQGIKGFSLSFDWNTAGGSPSSFDFAVNDANYNVIASGSTVQSVAAIPEPSSYLMMILGIAAIRVITRRKLATR